MDLKLNIDFNLSEIAESMNASKRGLVKKVATF